MNRSYLPVAIILAFYILTYGAYITDFLISYPSRNDLLAFAFLFTTAICIVAGFVLGLKGPTHALAARVDVNRLANVGLLAMLFLLIPNISAYTGHEIADLGSVLVSPGDAHRQMVETVTGTRDERLPLLVLKAALSPLTVVALPYFAYSFFCYRRAPLRYALCLTLFLVFSAFRGTDKEVFDVFLLSLAAYVVAFARKRRRFPSRRAIRNALYLILAVSLLILTFGFRKIQRVGLVTERCMAHSAVCYSLAIGDSVTPVSATTVILAAYLTQGYYGFSCALDGDYVSGYGFAHSRPLRYLASQIGLGREGVLVDQLDDLGWVSRGNWSSALVAIGNDVPMFCVPLVLMALASAMGLAWKQAVSGTSEVAVVVFVYLFYTFIYLPANLQLAQSGDTYIGFLFWLAVFSLGGLLGWVFQQRSRPSAIRA